MTAVQSADEDLHQGRDCSAYLCDPEGNYLEIVRADLPNNPVVLAFAGRPAYDRRRIVIGAAVAEPIAAVVAPVGWCLHHAVERGPLSNRSALLSARYDGG